MTVRNRNMCRYFTMKLCQKHSRSDRKSFGPRNSYSTAGILDGYYHQALSLGRRLSLSASHCLSWVEGMAIPISQIPSGIG